MVHLTHSTKPKRASDIKRSWHLFNAKGKVLGRLATEVATTLTGKDKTSYVPYLDMGDYAVVVNAKDIVLTGRKRSQNVHTRYSGYPGGLKRIPVENLLQSKPERVVQHAVSGMLAKNKLRDKRIKRLFVYADDKHPHSDKFRDDTK